MEDLKLKSQAALANNLCLSRDTAQECRTAAQGGTKLGVRGVTVKGSVVQAVPPQNSNRRTICWWDLKEEAQVSTGGDTALQRSGR